MFSVKTLHGFFLLPFFLLGLLSMVCLPARAQLNNTFFSDHISLDSSKDNTYGISLQTNTYLRNTEYFNLTEVGRTLFGYQLNPSFYIQPNKHVLLQTGVYLRNDYGSKSIYTHIIPTFTLKIAQKNKTFLFGTLEGALAHNLAEPLIDINSGITARIENGFQYRNIDNKKFLDIWINWERYIERGSPYKEGFTAGISYKPKLISTKNNFSISTPLQFTAFHRGGQIDTDTSKLIMVFNTAIGLELNKKFNASILNELSLSFMHLNFRENSSSGYFPFRNGQGRYANLFLKTKWIGFMLSYWSGHHFISPRGTQIYQSTSIDNPGYLESNRRLLFIRFLYEKEIYPKFYLVARYEPFIDLGNKLSDYSYSVYLAYRENFTLGKLKR